MSSPIIPRTRTFVLEHAPVSLSASAACGPGEWLRIVARMSKVSACLDRKTLGSLNVTSRSLSLERPWCLTLARACFAFFGVSTESANARKLPSYYQCFVIIETLTMKQKQTPPNKRPYPIPSCSNQANPKAPRIYVIQELKHRNNSPNLAPLRFQRKDLSDSPSGLDGLRG